MRLKVYHTAESLWVKSTIFLTVFSISSTIVLCLYVTVRETDLPLLMYVVYPYTGAVCTVALFWMCYEIIMVQRTSEAVVGTLNSTMDPYFAGLSRTDKM